MELMARYEDNHFDLAIVDPPYGIDIAKWDKKELKPSKEYFEELFRVSKNQIIWGGNYFNLPHNQGWLCWDKTFSEAIRQKKISTSSLKIENISHFELAWVSCLKKATFIRYTNIGNLQGFNDKLKVDYNKPKKIHITEKPIQLYEWLLMNYAKEGDKILDTHLGSGSIASACHNLEYDLTACELDKDYYNAAMKRLKQHQQQLKMF